MPPMTGATMIAKRSVLAAKERLKLLLVGGWCTPSYPRLLRKPKPPRKALAPTRLAEPAPPPHQHRVVPERLREIDRSHQELLIPRRRDPETLADQALLRAALQPPRALEIQDRAGALVELGREVARLGSHGGEGSGRCRRCKHPAGGDPKSPAESAPTRRPAPRRGARALGPP